VGLVREAADKAFLTKAILYRKPDRPDHCQRSETAL
jgi:hypothetical protein